MLLFQREHVQPILEGRKWQTRRLWPKGPRVRIGSVHQARTRMLDKGSTFALLHITNLWREYLSLICHADALAEGYPSVETYLAVFKRINRINTDEELTQLVVWAVEFELEPEGISDESATV